MSGYLKKLQAKAEEELQKRMSQFAFREPLASQSPPKYNQPPPQPAHGLDTSLQFEYQNHVQDNLTPQAQQIQPPHQQLQQVPSPSTPTFHTPPQPLQAYQTTSTQSQYSKQHSSQEAPGIRSKPPPPAGPPPAYVPAPQAHQTQQIATARASPPPGPLPKIIPFLPQARLPTPPAGPPPGAHNGRPPPSTPSLSFKKSTGIPGCSGRKAILTKYNTFYVFTKAASKGIDGGFCVCSSCYLTEIARYPGLSANFESSVSGDLDIEGATLPSERSICDFWLPVFESTFYSHCLPQNNIQPLVDLARQLAAIPGQCPGNALWGGGDVYVSTVIPDCTICTRCYETLLKPAFGSHFTKKTQESTDHWYCDTGKEPGFFHDILFAEKGTPNFAALAKSWNERFAIQPCPGVGKNIMPHIDGKFRWYEFTLPGTDLGLCEECYYDEVATTSLGRQFKLVTVDATQSASTCDLSAGMSKFLMAAAIRQNNIGIWHQAFEDITNLPDCEGIKSVEEETIEKQRQSNPKAAVWYHVKDNPIVECCPSCYHCVVVPLGLPRLFNPIVRTLRVGVIRTCNFAIGPGGWSSFDPFDFPNTLYWRGFVLRKSLEVACESNQQDFGPFQRLAAIFQRSGPPCGSNIRGFKSPNARKWYGRLTIDANNPYDCSIAICQECYTNHVADEPALQPYLGIDLTAMVFQGDTSTTKEASCLVFSQVSKHVLKTAAVANDWTIFARHFNNRMAIRNRVLPLIAQYTQQYQLQNMQKMSAMNNAVMVRSGAGTSEAAGVDGANYGNARVGMGFASRAGVDAAMWQKDADDMKWGDSSIFIKIAQLEAEWKAVE